MNNCRERTGVTIVTFRNPANNKMLHRSCTAFHVVLHFAHWVWKPDEKADRSSSAPQGVHKKLCLPPGFVLSVFCVSVPYSAR